MYKFFKEWVKRSGISTLMMQYSLLDRRPEEECLPLLLHNGIGVLARGSLAQGLLVNKPAKEYVGRMANEIKEIGAWMNGQNKPSTVLAIQYVLRHPAISAAVVGIRTKDQLADAVSAIELLPLSDDLYRKMSDNSPSNFYTEHR